MYQKTWTLKVN